MNATLYTDASTRLASSWAYYAISDMGRVKNAGICPLNVASAGEAEAYAIFAAMEEVNYKWDVDEFAFNTDSNDAIYALRKEDPILSTHTLRLIRSMFYQEVGERPFVFKKVKAHLHSSTTVKTKLNNICHELANDTRIAHEDHLIKQFFSTIPNPYETQTLLL